MDAQVVDRGRNHQSVAARVNQRPPKAATRYRGTLGRR